MTRAIPVVARRAGCTQKVARAALLATFDGEWHHTGNRARRTDYFNLDAAIIKIDRDRLAQKIEHGCTDAICPLCDKIPHQRQTATA